VKPFFARLRISDQIRKYSKAFSLGRCDRTAQCRVYLFQILRTDALLALKTRGVALTFAVHAASVAGRSSGPHDFAVRAQRHSSLTCRVHRIPSPTSVTIAKRPFVWAGMARDMQVIWVKREREYFCGEGWTGSIMLNQLNKLPSARRVG
jgi:hypothetical protein